MPRPLCIATLDLDYFQHGGVVTKALVFARVVREQGFDPFFLTPSVTLHRTLRRTLAGDSRDKSRLTHFGTYPCHQLGAMFPELEFNAHKFDRDHLRTILSPEIPCFAVSGNNHAARPFLDLNLPFSIWPSSTFWTDCEHRIREAPWSARKILDLASKFSCEGLERRIFESAQKIAIDTKYTERETLKLNPSWKPKITRIPIPIDCHTFCPASSSTPRHLLFLGRLPDPRKNLSLLLNAFTHCAPSFPHLELVLVGGSNNETVKTLSRHPFASRIRHVSGIPEAEKIALIRNAVALVIPSLQEGFGIVGTEALACGIPVISTPCGGTEDFVLTGETGIMLKDFDSHEMSNAISEIAGNETLRTTLGRQARQFALEKLSFEAVRPALQKFIFEPIK